MGCGSHPGAAIPFHGAMREIDEKYVSAEAMDESGRLGYEFYRQEFLSSFESCTLYIRTRRLRRILSLSHHILTGAKGGYVHTIISIVRGIGIVCPFASGTSNVSTASPVHVVIVVLLHVYHDMLLVPYTWHY